GRRKLALVRHRRRDRGAARRSARRPALARALRPDRAGAGPRRRPRRAEGGRRERGARSPLPRDGGVGAEVTGFLALEDGAVFSGESVGAPGFAFGEAVFATSMTGYQELVTDPSYAEQLLCFTAPMVGKYGVAGGRSESSRVHVRGAVMREAKGPAWTDWLHERGIPALTGIDTRSLVLHLREQGAMRGVVVAGGGSVDEAVRAVNERPSMKGRALVAEVSTPELYVYSDLGRVDVAVVDYGCKRSILRRLAGTGAAVTVYPHAVDAGTLAG